MLKLIIILLGSISAIAVILFLMPIEIKVKTIRKDNDDIIVICIRTLYGAINLKFEVSFLDIIFVNNKPAIKYQADIESSRTNKLLRKVSKVFSIDDFHHMRQYFQYDPVLFNRMKRYWFRKLRIYDLSLILKYGTSDAALSAMIYGAAWTIIGAVLSLVTQNINTKIKDIIITPWFDREGFCIELNCIIKFKFGDIINIGIMVLKRRKEKKRKILPQAAI